MFVDSHAHLSSEEVYPNVDAILLRAREAKVDAVINICTDLLSLEWGLALQERYPWVFNTAATTPHDVERYGAAHFDTIANAAYGNKLVAVGETGLDYHYQYSSIETQKEFLSRYLELALKCELPIVIHCRDAFDDLFKQLDREYQRVKRSVPGVLHCFTGTLAEAKEVVARGFMLSLSGIVTFKKSEGLREVAHWVPLEKLLIETDTPYLAPQTKRGKQNEPSYLPETAECIANLRGLSLEALAQATSQNAKLLFGIL